MTDKAGKIDVGREAFRLGDWVVEPSLNMLRREDNEAALEPRLMTLLTFLAAHRGEVATKEAILESVWNGLAATDESLSQAIFQLRKTLGDDPERPLYIETIRKKGYRLIAEVAPLEAPRSLGRWVALAAGLVAVAIGAFVISGTDDTPLPVVTTLEARPITSRPGRERDPDISSDGQYIVYSALDENGAAQIFLHGVGSGAQDRQLTTRDDNGTPVFFSDDQRIAFLRRSGERCTVMSMTLVDGAERVLGNCAGNGYRDAGLSPDDRFIAFNARDDASQPFAIHLLDMQADERRALTSPPAGTWGDYDPAFSRAGRYLFFARSVSEGMQDIYRLELGNGVGTRLTVDGRNVFGLAAHNGRLYYGTNRSGSYALWSIGFDGSDRRRLPIGNSGLVNPAIAADGSRLVYEKVERTVDLVSIELGSNADPAALLSFNADILHPDVPAGTRRIVFSSNRSGHYEIWDADAGGGDLRQLTRFESGFTAHPKYSPDGQSIAFDARPEGVSRVYVMYADGSELREIPTGDSNAYSPTWSRDGQSLLFAMETSSGLEIHRADLATNAVAQVTRGGGSYAVESPAGDLFYIRPGHDGIWQWNPASQEPPSQLLSKPEAADWGSWALTERGIVYYDRESRELKRFDLASGNTEVLAMIAGDLPTADPALAVDKAGTKAWLSIRRRLDSDIEIVDLP